MPIIDFSKLSFLLLLESHELKPFDCGDKDLNSFLFKKALHYKKELLFRWSKRITTNAIARYN